MNDKFLSLLGLAKKAGKVSSGHDASFGSIQKGKAKICFLTTDASQRLKDEFIKTTRYDNRQIKCTEIPYTQKEINFATGIRAAVLTINDEGFAKKLIELLTFRED
ncbi:MAG: 50S ribosomal protein L7ae [Ruminococcaceae bacterium]|jgi:ribosomal protein L7Ae-like RNA K-turn-binding protein|nr:50S ribosomal protein L7ae [Oscillospiraceae bacterium]